MQRRAFDSVRSTPSVRLRSFDSVKRRARQRRAEERREAMAEMIALVVLLRGVFRFPRRAVRPSLRASTPVGTRPPSDPAYAPIGTPHTPVDSSTPGFATPSLFSRSLDFRLTDGAALILRQPRREAVDVKHVSARGEAPHGFLRLEFHATHRALFLLLILALLRDVRSHGKGVHISRASPWIACRSVRPAR